MELKDKGRWAVATQKHLVGKRIDTIGLEHFDKTIIAGKCGRLLARIRQLGIVEVRKLYAIGRTIGIMPSELERIIIPTIEENTNSILVKRDADGQIIEVEEYIPSRTAVLELTGQIWGSTFPKPVEFVNFDSLDYSLGLPRTEVEQIDYLVSQGYPEEIVKLALELQISFGLLGRQEAEYGLREPILYNEYIWGEKAAQIYNAIRDLSRRQREQLIELLEKVANKQGYPVDSLDQSSEMFKLAKKTGILDITGIRTTTGAHKQFATTPQMWGTLSPDQLADQDIFDDVKLFLDSIRYGQLYTDPRTGRILSPIQLLRALLRNGAVGPCTAIGTDYPLVEEAGIVSIERDLSQPGEQYIMQMKKEDVVRTVLDVLEHQTVLPLDEPYQITPSGIEYPGSFISAEETRSREPEMPHPVREAYNALLTNLRS
ncbi:MAG TPA: hypothetical protein EYP19_10370 [Desulfobacterales bacterium]|nr:hypothetical protein [Desulfobacterales bacterium]